MVGQTRGQPIHNAMRASAKQSKVQNWPVSMRLVKCTHRNALRGCLSDGADGGPRDGADMHFVALQTRAYARTTRYKKRAIKIATIDSTIALCFAFFVNAAILILSASTFHGTKNQDVTEIADAFRLLSPTLGAVGASTIFAIALLGPCPGVAIRTLSLFFFFFTKAATL